MRLSFIFLVLLSFICNVRLFVERETYSLSGTTIEMLSQLKDGCLVLQLLFSGVFARDDMLRRVSLYLVVSFNKHGRLHYSGIMCLLLIPS